MMRKNILKKIKKYLMDALFIMGVLGGLVILFYLLWWADTQDFHGIYTMRGVYEPH